ncbi:alpha,alpha-phosphotrehalase [Dellaglioa sp. P0083]|uniref:alpha,alpha-phosphotrehalase n=1 Tax=Dellaglioa kimchii TaxID=3344667 RepID=UPI0038D37A10
MTFEDKVIYQIYPKSFYDSNNDGLGDLQGIIAKIPYLKQLNIDMIWFNPFFISPQNDNGYDISDYYHIDPKFGTMADFDELVAKLKSVGIDVMMDMVFNHTSTEHEWFQKALKGDPKYMAYYYIRDAKPDSSLPTNWDSKFGGPAWEAFGNTGKYYLHLYDPTQADLDWHNPAVRKEMAKIVNFWRNKGVKGFRFDVINVIGKDVDLLDAPYGTDSRLMYTDKKIVHQYLQELNESSFGQDPDAVTVGEMSSTSIDNCIEYTLGKNNELSMVFTFHHLKVDYTHGNKWTTMPFDFMSLKNILNDWQLGMTAGHGWNALFWNNHDQPRAINRFGDPVHYREKSAEMLATTIHLLRGTPFIYMGEEIGMSDPQYQHLSDYNDIETKNIYPTLLAKGLSKTEALDIIQAKSRDNSRTPMQWDNSEYAGFSTEKPWLMPMNQSIVNVQNELVHGEIFNYYQQLIKLRKTLPIVSVGDYQPLLMDDTQVFAYLRTLKNQRLIVLNNFYGTTTTITLPAFTGEISTVINNYPTDIKLETTITLAPYQSVAFLID